MSNKSEEYIKALLRNERFMSNIITRYGNGSSVDMVSLANAIHHLDDSLNKLFSDEPDSSE